MPASIVFTAFQVTWAIWWATLHQKIRRNRAYAANRVAVRTDAVYRLAMPALYLMQNVLCIATFWSSSSALLCFHHSDAWRTAGVMLFCAGSALYARALRHLGANYSPCFDTHAPTELVESGPYRLIRHPMYAAKLVIGLATLVLSGSLWFVPTTLYFFSATLRAMWKEDAQLAATLSGYSTYQRRTYRLLPWIC